MKWVSLLKDFKEKVGLTASTASTASSPSSSASPSPYANDNNNASSSTQNYFSSSSSRDKYELELDFKRHWEEFRSSSSEKEKEKALNMTVDIFCRFVKQHSNVAQLITMLVETHIFSFVVGRAFVTDIDKLRLSSKARLLEIESLLGYFSEVLEDGIQPGSNLLQAVEYLVSGPIDKQSLLDSGILCCLIHILNALLGPDGRNTKQKVNSFEEEPEVMDNTGPDRRFEVEGSVVHIMKALASHPAAVQSLIEDNSLQLLFEMVANGSLILFSRYKDGFVPLHTIQLHRHTMQILSLLMANDNGSTTKYIRKHQLMKVLLLAVRDFKPETGDPAYTMSIVDLLLECIELSYRPEAGDIRLREDVRNAHGYQYLVQFALLLSKYQDSENSQPTSTSEPNYSSEKGLSPTLSRLLDVLVNLSQTGPPDAKLTGSKGNRKRQTTSSDRFPDDKWEKDNYKVKDIDAIQVLQDIFLKADSRDLQAEVLNRMFKIFSSHLENYMLCQQLRTVPLLILNMGGFPSSLQEIILKILEYAVTVVNCIPEQELLALCCLLQQQITSELKHTILSFFVKLLSFDQKYKRLLREVGVLEVLLDDLKQHKFVAGPDQENGKIDDFERISNSSSFKKHLDNKDAIISSPKLLDSGSGKFSLFEAEGTVSAAWDCLFYLLKKAEQNQVTFRSVNGVTTALPFLVYDIHRPGVLRVLSCLIIEDSAQVHSEELSMMVELLKSGMVTSALGSQYVVHDDAKCDVFGAIWRVLGANISAQRVFGEATGFSLLLTTLHSFQGEKGKIEPSFLTVSMKGLTNLLRVTTAGVCNNAVNREKLNTILSSQTFYDLLSESGLICVESERQVIQLLLELALEIVIPPFSTPETNVENLSTRFPIVTQSGSFFPDKKRIYNPGALRVLIRSLLLFTPKLQLELLKLIEELACAGPFNQENLTSAGCVELLLETIYPFLSGSSSLLSHALKIVEVLGAYRLSTAELRMIIRCLLQVRQKSPGYILVDMMEKIVIKQDTVSENAPLAPFVQMNMRKIGYASIHVPLGERSWPPSAGYSFVCWFQYCNFIKLTTNTGPPQVLRIFSVGATGGGDTFYAELSLQQDGTLTLSTSNSSSLTFSGLDINEDQWHHLAVVHSKPNALAGLFQASVAYVYLNGKLKHTGRLGYSPSPAGKSLQITIGTPITYARISDMAWTLRSCYLFEEVLTPGSIFFMYILGRGYRGLFQDTNLLQFVPNQACRGGSMAILDSLETDLALTSNSQRGESGYKQGNSRTDRSGMVWDFERLDNLSLQLSGKKLIFAFDGTSTEAFPASGTLSMLNLVDPLSAAASPIGGIPRYGRLHGDVYVCQHCIIGETLRPIGGIAVVLALVEVAETSEMLQMALNLLACALNQNPQNIRDMQAFRGYHLLALFLHSRMSLFDMRSLEIFFQIAACEASFPEPKKLEEIQNNLLSPLPSTTVNETSFEELNLSKYRDEISSDSSRDDLDDFSTQKDAFTHLSELNDTDILPSETSNCIVLSNPDMVEHVLLDWTVWVAAEIPIQIALLGFLENLVSMHWYRNHNLTILRRINLVQHLLVTLQRGDVEVPVLEKLVVLLGVILEDGFVISELEHVVRFVIMTFDPPNLTSRIQITREPMGKHIIVRNMLLEMLIDLLVTISSEELLEQWHKIVSSKLITYFLDEGVHPTSMRWIMTLLGVCLTSSSTFALKFRTSGGYQGLMRVLPSFYDSPDIYYVLFCLIFGKSVYPRLPEVRMLDFHALMPSDGNYTELRFLELLDSVIAMAKSTFDRLSVQTQVSGGVVAEIIDGNTEMTGDLQGEALMHKTYAARLMGGEASAPAATSSVLRFMVDLAKMCPPFSAVCRRAEFIESCVDLYFSCVMSSHAVMMAKELSMKTEEKNTNEGDDTSSSQNTFSSLPHELEESANTSISITSFPPVQGSASSEDIDLNLKSQPPEPQKSTMDCEPLNLPSETKHSDFPDLKITPVNIHPAGSPGSPSLSIYDSPILSERSNSRFHSLPSPSQVLGFPSWLGSAASPSMESSVSLTEFESTPDLKSWSSSFYPSYSVNSVSTVNPKLLLDVDDSGYGGGPCSVAATAVLDFMAEVLADFVTENIKATPVIETILETVPLYVDPETVLVFQGLCLTRLMNFLERRLLRDDEEDEKKLDKTRWSLNLDSLCYIIVDRVYMGAFPQPAAVLKTLEFLLSMLQLANKDGRIEQAPPAGKGPLSIGRGVKQLDAYVHSVFKNMNRVTMYCFLPSFLISIGEEEFLSRLGLQIEPKKRLFTDRSQEDGVIDICTVLQLLVAHSRIIFCPSNLDNDLICCLCLNLISLLHDQRPNARNLAVDILKHILVHRRPALEDFLVSKPNQGPLLDVLHGGFDLLLTGSLTTFFDWLYMSELIVNRALEQCAAIMWVQYVAGSVKFPGVRIKGMDSRRKKEIGRKSRDLMRFDQRHWEQVNERRIALELVRDAMSTELRVVRQDKYGWVLHAESEWQTQIQQLIHEKGIFSLQKSVSTEKPEWQLCSIEGPYRMRKKFERCKLKVDTVKHILNREFESEKGETGSDSGSDPFPNLLSNDANVKQESFDHKLYDESIFKDLDSNERDCSINDESLHSAAEFSMKSSSATAPLSESIQEKSILSSPKKLSSIRLDEINKAIEDKLDKESSNNGEYLIRPYLLPTEKIKFRYNCERVVGLDKHDGIFLIGELCLYVIENFYIDELGCICEKECEDGLSVIDQALGVTKDFSMSIDSLSKLTSSWGTSVKSQSGGRAWEYNGGAWGKEKVTNNGNVPHLWRMWKLNSVYEILKRDYQLRPVAVEIFSMDGCNDLLVFHKKEREEVFKNLLAMNLPRNSMLDTTISGSVKQESAFKIMAKSFSKRWQNGEITNFQYLMHLNTLAGRGYSDLTQYPVFPWVLADYESENLDLNDPKSFRNLDKPMGCQTEEGEDEFKKRYESWDDPEIPKFHYGSHYSSAGIVLFYLLRLPPFSTENQTLQGGQFDHADRLFNSVRDTWLSAAGRGNTSDVKELIPEFFYLPEFLENRFDLDLGEKQSGERVGDVVLPPWAKGSVREFIRKHREALESDYVSENLHHWIDLIFGYKQRGKAAEEAVNVFYHYTYEGSVDIDSITDSSLKASILAQINHFGQTPKQLFQRAHPIRKKDKNPPVNPLKYSGYLVPHEIRKSASSIAQIVTLNDKILMVGPNNLLKPRTYSTYVAWGFPDRSLRYISYDQDKLLSTHENLHFGNQIQCASASHDGQVLVTGADDGLVCVWRVSGSHTQKSLSLEKALSGHTAKITCLNICQPYMMILSGSDDRTVVLWDLSSLVFIRQLPEFSSPVSAIYMNELTGEIVTAAGITLTVWSINGDCLSVVNTSQLPSDYIVCVTTCTFSDWLETNWYVSGHQSGAVKVWQMVHNQTSSGSESGLGGQVPEYTLVLRKVLRGHKHSVTALHLTSDMKQLLSGDSGGHLISWTLPDETLRNSIRQR